MPRTMIGPPAQHSGTAPPPGVHDADRSVVPDAVEPGAAGSEDAWRVVVESFGQAQEAVEVLLQALAVAGGQADLPTGPTELAWLTRAATRLAEQGQQVRVRSHTVLAAARASGRAVHDDDAQFAASKTSRTTRETRRDAVLAEALGQPTACGGEGAGADAGGRGAPPAGSSAGRSAAAPSPRPLARALDAGLFSQDHALIILQELEALPEEVPTDLRRRAEEVLVTKAQRLTPRSLRRAARRVMAELGVPEQVVDAHQNHRVRTQEQRAWETASFWMRDNGDGTVRGQFTLPVLQGHMLGKALDALVAPRRLARAASVDGTSDVDGTLGSDGAPSAASPDGPTWKDRQIDWAHEKGKALCELIDHLPTHELGGRTNVTLLVTTTLESLRGETDRVGLTDAGTEVSAGEVRRLAAGAGIVPVVLGGDSVPLDLGRRTRLFTETQRRALALRYTECAEEHCDRPFAWCEIHHVDPWASGGTRAGPPDWAAGSPGAPPGAAGGATDLGNAIPLCGRHHRRLEDPSLRHTISHDDEGRAVLRFQRCPTGVPR